MKEETTFTSCQDPSRLDGKPVSRREFMSRLALGGGALVLLSGCGRWAITGPGDESREKTYEFIAVDYTRCTGCRTCEAVCSAFNHPVSVDGEMRPGLGNPALSNIYVHSFNPDVSVPAVCSRCADTPCIKACPVDPSPETGRRAIFQDQKWGTITNDPDRCISCGSCVDACNQDSVGILTPHPETGKPMRMCTLCDGEPECVKHCPYEALSLIHVTTDHPFYRMSPEEIAKKLSDRWYDLSA